MAKDEPRGEERRRAARRRLLEGLDSGPAEAWIEADREALRAEVRATLSARHEAGRPKRRASRLGFR